MIQNFSLVIFWKKPILKIYLYNEVNEILKKIEDSFGKKKLI